MNTRGTTESARTAAPSEDLSGLEAARARVWEVLQPAKDGDTLGRAFDLFMFTLILVNVAAVVIETLPAVSRFGRGFFVFDAVSVLIFSVEYFARVWSCTADPRYEKPVTGRLRYAVTPMAVIDLLAIVPFYLPAVHADLRSLRILRLFRFSRALKLARYNRSIRVIGAVLRNKRDDLAVAVAALVGLLLLSSSLVYFAENAAQPDAFSSIPAAMWWGVATLTTVGYGDLYPVTTLGKVIASFISVLGIGLFALPAGILASGFAEHGRREREVPRCPHCGRNLEAEEKRAPDAAAYNQGYTDSV